MKRLLAVAIVAIVALAALAAAEEPVDRIVAVVNRSVVLESEVEEALRTESLIEGRPVASLTEADLRAATNRLIDQRLLAEEMSDLGIEAPSPEIIQARIADVRSSHPGAATPERWHAILAEYGIDEEILAARIVSHLQTVDLLDFRLRPTVVIEPEAVARYYRETLLPELRARGAAEPPLAQVQDNIREILVQRRMDDLLGAWLHNLRQQARITLHSESDSVARKTAR